MARKDLIELRRGTAAAWTAANPVLAAGEPGWESDTDKLKIGDGSTAWNTLPYFAAGASITRTLNVVIDGEGSVISTGVAGDVVLDFAATIQRVTLLADQVGSIEVDIWKAAYASFPPVVGNSITASDKPTLSGASHSQDSTLTGWTTAISAGDILRFNVDTVATITRVTVSLELST